MESKKNHIVKDGFIPRPKKNEKLLTEEGLVDAGDGLFLEADSESGKKLLAEEDEK